MSTSFDVTTLETEDIILYHDAPRLFVSVDPAGQRYMASNVAEDDDTLTYLYVALSPTRLAAVRAGEVPLRNAYTEAESGEVHVVVMSYREGSAQPHTSILEGSEIPEEWLAERGATL